MARFGVNILKRVSFRGGVQHFGNTYYYDDPLGTPAVSTLEALVDDIVAKEKVRHSTQVTFVRGRCWSQVGTPAQNQMLVDKALSGTGAGSPVVGLDKERAYLVRFRAGTDSLGRPVYLRKWWHLCGSLPGASLSVGAMENTSELTSGERTTLETFADAIKQISVGTPSHQFNLVAKGGRAIDGPTNAHRFLEHHQLGDEWRGL
jgi:hypothetical protein